MCEASTHMGVVYHVWKALLTTHVCAVLAGVYIAHAVSHYADSAFGTTLVPLLNNWLNNASVSYNALNELLAEVPAIGEQLSPQNMQCSESCCLSGMFQRSCILLPSMDTRGVVTRGELVVVVCAGSQAQAFTNTAFGTLIPTPPDIASYLNNHTGNQFSYLINQLLGGSGGEHCGPKTVPKYHPACALCCFHSLC